MVLFQNWKVWLRSQAFNTENGGCVMPIRIRCRDKPPDRRVNQDPSQAGFAPSLRAGYAGRYANSETATGSYTETI